MNGSEVGDNNMKEEMMKYKLAGNLETTISGKYIYTLLSELANESGEVQIPVGKISRTLKIGKNTVRRNLHRLEEAGYIHIRSVYREDGGRAANIYIIK